jgi:hypothetical protein
MEYIEKIKKMLCKELDEYAMKNKLTMNDLQPVHLMTDIIKNLGKIEMLEEESGGYSEARGGRGRSYMGGSSYDDDMMYSERQGRGRYAKRDRMGRYSSEGSSYEGGSSYDDYSEESSYRGGQGGRGYSRGDAKDHMMNKLGMMMEDADPKEREALKECMRAIERA